MTLLVGLSLSAPAERVPVASVGSEPRPEHPEAIEAERVEYRRAADALWNEMWRHRDAHGCDYRCPIDEVIGNAWGRAHEWAVAFDWLLLGDIPIYPSGGAKAEWVTHWFAGPWPAGGLQP